MNLSQNVQQREISSAPHGTTQAPAMDSEVPSPATPEKSSHLAAVLSWQGPATFSVPLCSPRPVPPLLQGERVPACAAPSWPGPVPFWGTLCLPRVLQLVGTVHPPVPGLPGSSFWAEGQQERPPHSLGPSMLYLQLSVGKQRFMFVFCRVGGQAKVRC